jgi:thioredoxin reductase
MTEMNDDAVDVVVIGGGPAGLSGAVALARSRRSVLVIDAGEARNATAGHAHNFLTRDGVPPDELRALGADELLGYGGSVVSGRVESVTTDDAEHRFTVRFGGRSVRARRLLMATGSRDELPDVPGLWERWGRDVLHCPYCHGWEVRDQRIAVLVTGPTAMHQALMFRQLSDRVTLLAHAGPELSDDQRAQCVALGIEVVEGRVTEVNAIDDRLAGVTLVTPAGEQRNVEWMRWWWRRGSCRTPSCSRRWASRCKTWSSTDRSSGAASRPTRPGRRPCPASGWPATWPTRWHSSCRLRRRASWRARQSTVIS